MIERVVIHRFRGIHEGVLEDLSKINLLIGPNNSGKTAILELLYLTGLSGRNCGLVLEDGKPFIASAPLPYDLLGYAPLPRLRRRHGQPEKGNVAQHLSRQTVEGGLEITLPQVPEDFVLRSFRLAAPLPEGEAGDQRVTSRFFKKDTNEVTFFSLNRPTWIPSSLIPSSFQQKVQAETSRWHYLWEEGLVYQWDRKVPLDNLAVWAAEGRLPDPEKTLLFDFHTTHRHFTDRFTNWAYRHIPDWHEKIAAALAAVFPPLTGARVEIQDAPDCRREKIGYLRFPNRTPLAVDSFGDGTRHAFKTLTGLIALAESVDEQHPGLFLWEDPELFMHPESLGGLLDQVVQLSQDKPVQVFLSSQSLEVIAILTHHIQTKYPHLQETLRAFRLGLEQGQLYAARYRFQNLRTWLEQGMDPRYWDVETSPLSYDYRVTKNLMPTEEG